MTKYVYILSEHDEYGAENVCATLDRSKLIGLVDENWPSPNDHDNNEEAKTALVEILKLSDADLAKQGKWNCQRGWGGTQLHVVELK